ncbi:ABC transporter substrate-binding protein [Alicyclobacillus ferrooxydans]|uniref:Solute-binding protein family 5 domain-containing protein n=1 Tax=Alicyclobacillus ferrooxydans TaxID=471514 RepID=A0A0P9EII4_9BACL|nr:ABC transporter substrate-binding protein [Alicyclobacillus ferrooxydans]KPV42601.1 hypothetical protein AN477_16580 [Alicyclobacillus ferrooxydans]
MKRIGKGSMATIALAASLTMLVAGCGSGGGSTNSSNGTGSNSSNNTSTTTTGQPVDGGTLTMAQGTKFNDELIPDMDASLYTANVVGYAFDPLMNIDKNLNFVSDLAQTWTWSSDKKTVTITLANANWSDGQPVTSDDVLFTMNYLASKAYNTTLQGQYGYLVGPVVGSTRIGNGKATSFASTGGFKKISAKQFSITFKTVDAAVLWSDISSIQPIPEHVLKNIPISSWNTASYDKQPTVVDGPYTFKQVNGQDSVEYTANPNYFQGKPHITNLVIKTVSPDVVPGLLANGSVQYVLSGLKPTDVAKLKQIPGIVVKTPPENGFSYLGIKDYLPEFKNYKVRQALEYGLNRQAMVDGILKGLGTPISGPLPPVSWAAATTADGMNPYNYNPTKAGQLLDQAGWKMGSNGFRIDPSTGKEANLTLSYSSGDPTVQAEAVAIQSDLAKIGIKVTLNSPMDFNTLASKVESNDKSIQMWLMGWSLSIDPDPRGLWMSTDAFNFERWKNKTSDQMINATWDAAAFNKADRKAALIKWQLYVNQRMPLIFLWAPDNVFAYSSKLNIPNKDFSSQGPLNIQDWWLTQ